MNDQPYHQVNLRDVLLDQAEIVLRERGVEALSLHELAREAGLGLEAAHVPFTDREALLDALAERGYRRLEKEIRAAARPPNDHARVLRSVSSAYVDFAVRGPALLEVMFAAQASDPSPALQTASDDLLDTLSAVVDAGVDAGAYDARAAVRLTPLLMATVQGIAATVTSRRITAQQSEGLIEEAVTVLLAGVVAEADKPARPEARARARRRVRRLGTPVRDEREWEGLRSLMALS